MAQTKLNDNQITPAGNDTEVQYNNGGAFGGDADFVWEDVTKTFLIGGSNWYSVLATLTGGVHVSKEAGGAFTNVITGHSWVDGVDEFTGVPYIGADRAGGSRATPTAVLDNMGLVRLAGGGYDGTALSGTQAQVLLRAAGNWSGTSHPTKIEFWTTPTSSVTRRKVLTVGEDGNVGILTGKTYNVNGSPHTHTSPQILFTHGLNAGVAASTTYYLNLGNISGLASAVSNITVTRACTAQNLYFTTNSTQSVTGSLVVTLLKNSVATAITITIAAGTAAGTFSDIAHTVSLAAGDSITLEVKNNATATSALITRVAMELVF